MCTIALAWQLFADAPVALAANRDEALDRESLPPRVLDRDPLVVAPQDAVADGTWIGVTEHGLVVAITNRWGEVPEPAGEGAGTGDADEDADDGDGDASEPADDDRRSRGLLVRDALARATADAAMDFVRESVADHRYAGFNLLVADADRATYLEYDGNGGDFDGESPISDDDTASDDASTADGPGDPPTLRERDLEPGVHVVVNPGLNEVDDRARRLREALAVETGAPSVEDGAPAPDADPSPGAAGPPTAGASESTVEEWLADAARSLRDHDYGVCVHGDGFGTRSSSLLAVGSNGESTYAYADGPPCRTAYEPVAPDVPFLAVDGGLFDPDAAFLEPGSSREGSF